MVIVSNRLPVALRRDNPEGEWTAEPSIGGLVTALGPVLHKRGGRWFGWSGACDPAATSAIGADLEQQLGYPLHPITLSQEQVRLYYDGFANAVLWPLFHDLSDQCNFDPAFWPAYQEVNQRFAQEVSEHTEPGDYIWFQDYHLLLAAAMLRQSGTRRSCGCFLHIPFPPLDIFLKLPWRFQILSAMLHFDLVGFQTMRDRRNFMQCVRQLIPGVRATDTRKAVARVTTPERQLRVGTFPIGIDYDAFVERAASKEAAEGAWYIHEKLPKRQLILGVDRLDYTKGIPHRLRAVGDALSRYPDLRGRMTFVQIVVPSRVSVPQYQRLKAEIERLVGAINGRFTKAGWTPIHYIFRGLAHMELLSYYRTAEIALVTPLKDGMNLVAKEYCACSLEENCVLLLSEFAGAAAQLRGGAMLVNPYDIRGTADTLYQAFQMDPAQRRQRMRRMRRNIQRQNVFWWVDSFLRATAGRATEDIPEVEDYLPSPKEALPTDPLGQGTSRSYVNSSASQAIKPG